MHVSRFFLEDGLVGKRVSDARPLGRVKPFFCITGLRHINARNLCHKCYYEGLHRVVKCLPPNNLFLIS